MIQNDKAQYSYDAEGLRYEMEENGNLVQFIFNQEREVVTEEDSTGITRLIRDTELIARSTDVARTYYHYASDEMGSTTHIVDEAGAVQNWYEYDAWGNITAKQEVIPNRYTYYGQQLDPITQQYYLRARFYNPVIGRFTQEDAYRGDGLNLYAYCANNPVFYVDPLGQYKDGLDAATRKNIRDYVDVIRKDTETLNAVKKALYDRVARGETLAVEDIYGLAYLKYGRSPQGHNLIGIVVGKDANGNSTILFADAYTSKVDPFKWVDNDAVNGEGTKMDNKPKIVGNGVSAMAGKLFENQILNSQELIDIEINTAHSSETKWYLKTHTEPKFIDVAAVVRQQGRNNGYVDFEYIMLGYQEPCPKSCWPLLNNTALRGVADISYKGVIDGSSFFFSSKR